MFFYPFRFTFCISFAAVSTALIIRLWAPHLHIFAFNVLDTSASVGLIFLLSNEAAVMIIPLVQYPHWNACSSIKAFFKGWFYFHKIVPLGLLFFVVNHFNSKLTTPCNFSIY